MLDIEQDHVLLKDPLPSAPQPFTSVLESNLRAKLKEQSKFQGSQEDFWIDFTLKVKQMFLNFVIYMVNNFVDFYKPEEQILRDGKPPASPSSHGREEVR